MALCKMSTMGAVHGRPDARSTGFWASQRALKARIWLAAKLIPEVPAQSAESLWDLENRPRGQTSEPRKRNIVQIRALSFSVRANIRLIALRAECARPHNRLLWRSARATPGTHTTKNGSPGANASKNWHNQHTVRGEVSESALPGPWRRLGGQVDRGGERVFWRGRQLKCKLGPSWSGDG